MSARWRIGVDIGGTFTDFVLLDLRSGQLHNEKVLTTPEDPSQAVLEGVRRLLVRHRVDPGEVQHVIHGTTLVANALIERKGVPVALVTTRGFGAAGVSWSAVATTAPSNSPSRSPCARMAVTTPPSWARARISGSVQRAATMRR